WPFYRFGAKRRISGKNTPPKRFDYKGSHPLDKGRSKYAFKTAKKQQGRASGPRANATSLKNLSPDILTRPTSPWSSALVRQAKPSQAKPSQAKPSRQYAPKKRLSTRALHCRL
ncbi:MAG: hypothetical protein ACPH3E_13040, partial [Paracoccaceae bacterium]